MKREALIIDDEPDIRELLGITLQQMGLNVTTCANMTSALETLKAVTFDVCLSDMKLPDGNGLDIVRYIQENRPDLPVAIITAHGSMDSAVEALKLGAFDFISKPVQLNKLRDVVEAALELGAREGRADESEQVVTGLTGGSAGISSLKQQIMRVSRSQAPIFISGESGSGKELVARAIHYSGPRSSGPFIPVNCGAIPGELMESEFFGHLKGSFTGANQNKQGLFQAANGGTLFLDEVADLPLQMQVKLLRAIQERAIRPVGSSDEVAVDIRILSATHKNLKEEIRGNRFREDLFYRINVIQLDVPPLRERTEDIAPLAENILLKLASKLDISVPVIAKEALQQLQQYHFPGNVRELENILERAMTLCENYTIRIVDLNLPGSDSGIAADNLANTNKLQAAKAPEGQLLPPGYNSIDEYLEEIEKGMLLRTLETQKWNKTASAKALGISFRQIRYKLKKYGLDDDS